MCGNATLGVFRQIQSRCFQPWCPVRWSNSGPLSPAVSHLVNTLSGVGLPNLAARITSTLNCRAGTQCPFCFPFFVKKFMAMSFLSLVTSWTQDWNGKQLFSGLVCTVRLQTKRSTLFGQATSNLLQKCHVKRQVTSWEEEPGCQDKTVQVCDVTGPVWVLGSRLKTSIERLAWSAFSEVLLNRYCVTIFLLRFRNKKEQTS